MPVDDVNPSTAAEPVPARVEKERDTHETGFPSTLPGGVLLTPASAEESTGAEPPFIGKYKILGELAAGGMGVVFKAWDPGLNRIVALKTIRSGALAGPSEVLRFIREAQAVAQLSHPNIVQIHDVGQHAGQHYFTMAFAPAGSLAVNRASFTTPAAVAKLIEKLARAVHHAHTRGILHRDLKPGNVLLDEQGEPLVSDFGLAKFVESTIELTQPGKQVGTVPYMAPEQILGQNERVGAHSDIWSLGVMMYELLAGQRPFVGATDQVLTRNILSSDPDRLRRRGVNRALEVLTFKCLEKDPARRFTSAEDLAEELARWQRGEPIRTRPLPWPLRLMRKARKHPLATGLGFVTLLVAIGAAIVYVTDPYRSVEARQRQLLRQDSVTLLGEAGPPTWSRWALGNGEIVAAADKPLSVRAWNQALLELMPAPLPERFRLSAEVRHTNGSFQSEVGIYFAYARRPRTDGPPVHTFCAVTFNDVKVQAHELKRFDVLENEIRLYLHLHWEDEPRGDFLWRTGYSRTFVPATRFRDSPWRKLAVEATPESTTVFWDGEPIGWPLPRAKLDREIALLLKQTKLDVTPLQPLFAQQDACGLFVRQGSASFKNVVIEPLSQ